MGSADHASERVVALRKSRMREIITIIRSNSHEQETSVDGALVENWPGHSQCIMKKRPASEGRSCDGRSICCGVRGGKNAQKDIGKSARELFVDGGLAQV